MYALTLTVLGSMVVFQSCSDDEDPAPTQTVWGIVQNTEGLDSLAKYIEFYGLDDALNVTPNITLFAPNNDAFDGLLATPGFPSEITSINPDIIRFVLSYHVVAQVINSSDLAAGNEYSTLITNTVNNPEDVIIVNSDGSTLLTGATNSAIAIVGADNQATNGVVHVTSSVLVPQSIGNTLTPILGTNAGTLLLGAPFSILASGIQKADVYAAGASLPTLTSILSGSAIHTVFAPTNDTFDAASITVDTFTGEEWYGIIANHAVLEDIAPGDITNGLMKTTAAGGTLTFATPGAGGMFTNIFINSSGDATPEAEIAQPDAAINSNGRVHVIAGILTPESPE